MQVLRNIEQLIKEKGINKKIFLEAMGMNKTTWSNWEKGYSSTFYENISKIADYFNVSTDYLLGRTEIKTALSEQPLSPRQKELLEKLIVLSSDDFGRVEGYVDSLKEKRTQ